MVFKNDVLITFRSSDSNSELASARSTCLSDEATLIGGEDAMFHPRTIDLHLAGIRSARHTQHKWASCKHKIIFIQLKFNCKNICVYHFGR